jgi:hypothetical protein
MADTDIILQIVYSTSSNTDMRTFNVYRGIEEPSETSQLYRVSHPIILGIFSQFLGSFPPLDSFIIL